MSPSEARPDRDVGEADPQAARAVVAEGHAGGRQTRSGEQQTSAWAAGLPWTRLWMARRAWDLRGAWLESRYAKSASSGASASSAACAFGACSDLSEGEREGERESGREGERERGREGEREGRTRGVAGRTGRMDSEVRDEEGGRGREGKRKRKGG
jgi:hypothetical protein